MYPSLKEKKKQTPPLAAQRIQQFHIYRHLIGCMEMYGILDILCIWTWTHPYPNAGVQTDVLSEFCSVLLQICPHDVVVFLLPLQPSAGGWQQFLSTPAFLQEVRLELQLCC